MTHRRRGILLTLAMIVGCGGETTTIVPAVTDVVITPASPQVEIGLSIELSAEARGASNQVISGQDFTWESKNNSVATVDSDGFVTAVSVGTAEIGASVGSVEGTTTVTVVENPCEASRVTVVIAPGDFAAFDSDECLLLPAGTTGDWYRVAVARPEIIEFSGDTSTVTLAMSPVLNAAPPRVPAGQAAPAPVRTSRLTGVLDDRGVMERLALQNRTRAFHMELRERERELGFGPDALLPSRPAGAPPLRVDPPASDSLYLDLSCFATEKKGVTLLAFDDNLAIYQDDASHAVDPLGTTATDLVLAYYGNYVVDMLNDYWGPMPDVDSNDGRVIVVTSEALDDGAAAAVFSGDLVNQTVCGTGNQAEVMYFQLNVLAGLEDMDDPSYFALGVLAHEGKHVVSLYNGIMRGAPGGPDFHELWIEEGTAEISQEMSSRIAWAATGGPAVGEQITALDIFNGVEGNQATPEMSGAIDALAGMAVSLSGQPNSLIVDPDGASDNHTFYGSSWHWHRFLGDAYGGAASAFADATFFRTLHDPTSPPGILGEESLTGKTFVEVFDELLVAMSYNGTGYTPARAITTWNFWSAAEVFSSPVANPPGEYPWPVTTTSTPSDTVSYVPFGQETFETVVGPSGVLFHDFRSNGVGAGVQVRVTGAEVSSEGGPVPGRIIVTRLD